MGLINKVSFWLQRQHYKRYRFVKINVPIERKGEDIPYKIFIPLMKNLVLLQHVESQSMYLSDLYMYTVIRNKHYKYGTRIVRHRRKM